MMEVEKPWETGVQHQPEPAMNDDEAAADGGLQTREMKKKMAGPGNGDNVGDVAVEKLLKAAAAAAAEEEEDKSVFFDPAKGLWKCRHCDWTHRLSSPCTDHIRNHQGYCQIARNLESLVRSEPFYYSPNKVSDHATEEDEVTEVVQFDGQVENSNETSIAEGKGTEEEENVNGQETNRSSSNGRLENGSHSNGVHEISRGAETMTVAVGEARPLKLIAAIGESKNILPNLSAVLDISNGSTSTTEVHEIEVEKDENGTKDKVNIEEYDLEKILDEQETHDLYCPNCKSCITRRVILKKRKRTARQAKREEPPKRPQLEEPSANVSDQTPVESHDQESPEVFRCLSCFTFFIPTGCGFNIFRIFERRDANQQVQVQHPVASQEPSEHCGSWLLSCFQTVDSPKKSTDADSQKEPLLSGSHSTDNTISVEDSASSSQSHSTVGEAEQLKKPLVAGSSPTVQIATGKNEEIKQPFSESHGTASSSVTVHTTSSQSETGLFTQTGHVVTEQRGGAHQEQIPPSKPADDMINGVHKQDNQGNTTGASGNNSFFNQPFFNPELKVPAGEKPTPVISQPSQSPHVVVQVPEATETPVPPAPSDQRDEWDILKAIVYGGLVESITSLSVVSAAAASGAKTLDIFILGIANLIGGIPVVYHNIADLRNTGDVAESSEQVGHYWLELGRRRKYRLHMVVAILSYILFGLLPPVIYGLSFRMSDNRENKMMAVAAASLMCIGLLAIAKAHVKRPRTYITTLLYYLSIGLSSSGLSYVAGVLITRLLAHFGLINQGGASAPAPPSLLFPQAMGADAATWASY
ncbi:membrane protein of ER body-like protein isoform X2 [Panicum virgatum]|uniref:membrane protein of ER body-like protein isoform X2 n=1 Tax=Panicum virgatum TaxID=38727 RepID=UPI0019D55AF7|nr:membrane protein of ER body-like protein isoform X2 [Panicum virgatum]